MHLALICAVFGIATTPLQVLYFPINGALADLLFCVGEFYYFIYEK